MTTNPDAHEPWSALTVERLNLWLDVVPDADVGPYDWPVAMAVPWQIDAALAVYDREDAQDDDRALVLELLLNTFEYCSIEREGNPDWRRTVDRIERDFDLHRPALERWAYPEDDNPWLISSALVSILDRHRSRG